MKPIVLATDGSRSAAEATLEAVQLAVDLGAPLVALAVEHAFMPERAYHEYDAAFAALAALEHDRVARALRQICAVAAEANVECSAVHAKGPAVDAICRVARAREARLIVVGSRAWGFGSNRRALLAGVATSVAYDAPCPVLIVPGDAAHETAQVSAGGTTELWNRV
jgi:nucleotide-binding universal stress UspA family protein